jgi:hypothetical protein
MKAHVVENGIVVNTILVDSLDFMPNLVADDGKAGIGWSYVDGVFTDITEPPITLPPATPTKEELLAQLQELQIQINSLA